MADGRSPRSIQGCLRVSLLWKPVPLESTIFLGSPDYISERDLIRCPSELRCLTRVKSCPSVEKLGLADGRLPRSIVLDPFYLYCSSFGSSSSQGQVPVKVQFQSSFSQVPVPGSKTSPIPSIRLTSSSSGQGPVPVKVQFQSRSSSSQVPVPGSKTSPIPSIRLTIISSSFRIQDESDPIDPTHQFQFQSRSSSSQGPVPVKVKFQSSSSSRIQDESDPIDPTQQYKFQFPNPRRVRSHRSDSPVPVPVPRIQVRSRFSHTSPIPSIRLSSTFQFTVPDSLLDRD